VKSQAHDDVLVCRCIEVSRADVVRAVAEGARSVDEVKRLTRAGMGICQGRTCGRMVAQIIHECTGIPLSDIALSRPRAPVRPVQADVLVQIEAPRAETRDE